jgi:hypothetical protein
MANYTTESGVTLEGSAKTGIGKIADEFFKAQNVKIHITSGTRSAASQAKAMYQKFKSGGKTSEYANKKAAEAIKKPYDDGLAAGEKEADIIKKMTGVIEGQIKTNVYISKHLVKGAVDVRSRDMDKKQKDSFKQIAAKHAKKVILETTPPHWHLQF